MRVTFARNHPISQQGSRILSAKVLSPDGCAEVSEEIGCAPRPQWGAQRSRRPAPAAFARGGVLQTWAATRRRAYMKADDPVAVARLIAGMTGPATLRAPMRHLRCCAEIRWHAVGYDDYRMVPPHGGNQWPSGHQFRSFVNNRPEHQQAVRGPRAGPGEPEFLQR